MGGVYLSLFPPLASVCFPFSLSAGRLVPSLVFSPSLLSLFYFSPLLSFPIPLSPLSLFLSCSLRMQCSLLPSTAWYIHAYLSAYSHYRIHSLFQSLLLFAMSDVRVHFDVSDDDVSSSPSPLLSLLSSINPSSCHPHLSLLVPMSLVSLPTTSTTETRSTTPMLSGSRLLVNCTSRRHPSEWVK